MRTRLVLILWTWSWRTSGLGFIHQWSQWFLTSKRFFYRWTRAKPWYFWTTLLDHRSSSTRLKIATIIPRTTRNFLISISLKFVWDGSKLRKVTYMSLSRNTTISEKRLIISNIKSDSYKIINWFFFLLFSKKWIAKFSQNANIQLSSLIKVQTVENCLQNSR
jgi:hypothetical protein